MELKIDWIEFWVGMLLMSFTFFIITFSILALTHGLKL